MVFQRTQKRIAIIGCEKPVFPIQVYGKTTTIRALTASRFADLGMDTIIHHPAANKHDFPKPGTFGGLVIGGSSLSVYGRDFEENPWMQELLDFVLEIQGTVPTLGLCFGHQAIAKANGAAIQRFGPDVFYEAGFSPVFLTEEGMKDELFSGMPSAFSALFSHFDYLAAPPEDGMTLLVGVNPSIQGYRLGESTWGIQYHPEFSVESVRWLISSRRKTLEGKVDVDAILAQLESEYRGDNLVLQNFANIVRLA